MDHNFTYRQNARQERLARRRRAALKRRVRALTTLFTVVFLFIMVVSANLIIANAGDGYDKEYQKQYASVIVEKGETVWDIASERITPGYETIHELIEEISFINDLDDDCSIQSGTVLIVPYFVEV